MARHAWAFAMWNCIIGLTCARRWYLIGALIILSASGPSVAGGAPKSIFVAAKAPVVDSGVKEIETSFGDTEGNPKNWPEPIFNDGATPWARIASGFDSVVFNARPNALGDFAFAITPWAKFDPLLGENGFGLDSYFGRNIPARPDSYQAITAMGALLGGFLAGIDYSNMRREGVPTNLIRLIKKWYNIDTGADVFLNNVHSRGGADWWYDILPNIFACQLSDLFGNRADRPGEPKLASLCDDSIERWYQVANYLRDGQKLPEFAYKAVQLVDGPVAGSAGLYASAFQPIAACDDDQPGYKKIEIRRNPDPHQVCFGFAHYNGDTYQPDAAAGLAYLGLYGFERTQNAEARQLADWGMTFLDNIDYNPLYENLLPYGAYVAARMDAEYDATYKVDKLLDDIFSTSTVRPHWGMIGGNWNGAPVYGLVGSRRNGPGIDRPTGPDYAFALNTMQFAATLAPIPRYKPSTALAIGKYLSHVAHNARFFYPAYLKYEDAETTDYIARSGSPVLGLSLPFEGIQSKFQDKVIHEPYGTGDALRSNRHGQFRTDLSVYSGVFAGAMARIFNETNVACIYQIDLLATDIPSPQAYPTYLFYNPYDQARSVQFRDDLVKSRQPAGPHYLLYDTVSKTVLAHNVDSTTAIVIPSHESVVVVAVPETHLLAPKGHDLIDTSSGTVIDYDWHSNKNGRFNGQ